MKWIFWGSAGLIAYTYFGYPFWLWLRSRWRFHPVDSGSLPLSAAFVMVVRNEEQVLEQKLQNLLAADYPPERLDIVVVSDGCSDGTDAILRRYAQNPRIKVVRNQLSRGKAAGLNDALQLAQGEIVIFTDARQSIEKTAVARLMENFADPSVGCVSGELMLGDPASGQTSRGPGLYWRIEKIIRELESNSGSVVGATGALYAVRRELIPSLPAGTILDDVYIPMQVVRKGKRIIFEPGARAWDRPDLGRDREFARKVRTLSGNYQLLRLAPWLLSRSNPLRFEFISHKVLRLGVPFALVLLVITSALLREPFYRSMLFVQMAGYGLSLLALAHVKTGPLNRISDAALTFVLLNTAALVAFLNFVSGRKVVWVRGAQADPASMGRTGTAAERKMPGLTDIG
jgi:poly-beta-1,6-N-acetyl-D-glucosamine synthase